jgi:hypothetical protein
VDILKKQWAQGSMDEVDEEGNIVLVGTVAIEKIEANTVADEVDIAADTVTVDQAVIEEVIVAEDVVVDSVVAVTAEILREDDMAELAIAAVDSRTMVMAEVHPQVHLEISRLMPLLARLAVVAMESTPVAVDMEVGRIMFPLVVVEVLLGLIPMEVGGMRNLPDEGMMTVVIIIAVTNVSTIEGEIGDRVIVEIMVR